MQFIKSTIVFFFTLLASVSAAAIPGVEVPAPVSGPSSSSFCSTGPVQCCNAATSSEANGLLNFLNTPISVVCNPIAITGGVPGGVGNIADFKDNCKAAVSCCQTVESNEVTQVGQGNVNFQPEVGDLNCVPIFL